MVSFRDGTWRRWKVLAGDGEFYAGGDPIALVTPSATREYRGRIRSASPSRGSQARDTVNVLTMDNYLRGVVPLEMPALWSKAAVRAQAVAARTYAAYERAHPRATHYQICDTTSCQVYGGYDAEHPAANAAVDATAGLALQADGGPAFTQFSSSSGGWTAAGSVPYLVAQEDPYDGWAGNPVHGWSVTFADQAIESRFPAIGNLTRLRVTARDGHGDWGGRVVSLTLVGGKGSTTVSGDTARSILGSAFDLVHVQGGGRTLSACPQHDGGGSQSPGDWDPPLSGSGWSSSITPGRAPGRRPRRPGSPTGPAAPPGRRAAP